jgi:hypothetical protein
LPPSLSLIAPDCYILLNAVTLAYHPLLSLQPCDSMLDPIAASCSPMRGTLTLSAPCFAGGCELTDVVIHKVDDGCSRCSPDLRNPTDRCIVGRKSLRNDRPHVELLPRRLQLPRTSTCSLSTANHLWSLE